MTGDSEIKRVGVFNSTSRIITLKACARKRKGEKVGRLLKAQLMPKTMTLIPEAYLTVFKRNAIVQVMLDDETLITGRSAKKAEEGLKPKEIEKADASAAAEAALVGQLEDDAYVEEEAGGDETNG